MYIYIYNIYIYPEGLRPKPPPGRRGRQAEQEVAVFFRPKTDSVSDPVFYRKKVVFIPQDPLRTPPGPSWGALGARRWILLDFLMILGSQMGPHNFSEFPGGPKGPPKKQKKKRNERK